MEALFTPGAQRALIEAAAWSSGIGLAELEAPALLLGLLAESECRAAIVLAGLAIDREAVQRQWPRLIRKGFSVDGENGPAIDLDRPEEIRKRLPRFCDELLIAMGVIRRRFRDFPPPLMLATEHLLLGLSVSGKEVSLWLASHGLDPAALEAEIVRRNGYEPQADVGPQAIDSGQRAAGSGQTDAEMKKMPPRLSWRRLRCTVGATCPSLRPTMRRRLPRLPRSNLPRCGRSTPLRIGPWKGCVWRRTTYGLPSTTVT